jgi:hypothetical protein
MLLLQLLVPKAYIVPVRLVRTMAINGLVISGPDPGAVPGASTNCPPKELEPGGQLWGRNRIDGRVKVVLSPGMVSAVIGLFVQVPTTMKWPSLLNHN